MIKVDVRSPVSLSQTLESQQAFLSECGGLSHSVCLDNNKRNIGYVILDWKSLKSLNQFLESSEANEVFQAWPVVEILECVELFDISEDINV